MTPDLVVPVVIAGVVLAFVSVLLSIRLGSAGVSPRAAALTIVELWLTFVFAVTAFSLVRVATGEVSGGAPDQELSSRIALFSRLPIAQRALLSAAVIIAAALFVHLIWTLNRVEAPLVAPPQGEKTDD